MPRTPDFEYNGHLFDLIWIWSDVLRPQDRFLRINDSGSSVRCTYSDEHLRFRLNEALAWETQHDMYEPDWPNKYWEEQCDLRELS